LPGVWRPVALLLVVFVVRDADLFVPEWIVVRQWRIKWPRIVRRREVTPD
jgi:hypothetical protein